MNASPKRLRDEDSTLGRRLREFGETPAASPSTRSQVLSDVEARLSKGVFPIRALVALTVGGLAVALVLLRPAGPPKHEVVFASRDAELFEPANPLAVAGERWGTRVLESAATTEGSLVLEENGTRLALLPRSRLARLDAETLRLDQGTLAASVTHEAVFESGGRQVRVRRGVVELQRSCLVVHSGSAELVEAGVVVEVTAGQRSPEGCVTERAERLLEVFEAPLTPLHVEASGLVVIDGVPLGLGPLDLRLKADAHTVVAQGVERRTSPSTTSLTIPNATTVLEAARQDSTTDPDRALSGFASIVDGPNAEVALYERAVLLQRTKAPGPALEALELHQRRFTKGVLALEAALTRAEVLISLERRADAIVALDGVLGAFPGSERTAEVHLLRGELLRQAQRCPEAVVDFVEAAKEGAWADEAAWGSVLCQRTAAAVSSYLAAFPRGAHADEARRLAGAEKF